MTFQEYCKDKRIDPISFQQGDPERYAEWERIFTEMSIASFTSQKLFLINQTRRKFTYTPAEEPVKDKKVVAKPVMKPAASAKPAILKKEGAEESKSKPKIVIPKSAVKKSTDTDTKPAAPKVIIPKPKSKSAIKPVIPKKKKE